ncbi:putative ABC-type transport system, permease component [Acidovorax sp. CF316]|uniref:exopolysaccharide biosynthesis protein n=1 Tax=Acidovorax sp. CF316 TaxID=1144317 RepID=UPI00026BDFAD|nr:exopolysaccharide biosynthesis protein [Acidovorax sp. CF316]EJE49379.1 putative ABC-type transport system, permease component [Acidovorax sp. CF316]
MTISVASRSAALSPSAGGQQPDTLGEILDEFDALAQSHGRVAVADLVDAVGPRSYGPFLLVPALIEISPLGGIPGVPTALAVVVVLFAAQMLSGRKRLWMPAWVARRDVAAARMKRLVAGARPMATRLDRWFHGRLRWLTSGLGMRLAALACIALACMVPPLELFPFASSVPMGAIALIGLALLVRDGALMIVASLLVCGAAGLLIATLL